MIHPMTCRETVRRMMDYVEDRLRIGQRRRFDAHLAECPPCRAFLESYRATPDIVRRATTGRGSSSSVSSPR